MQSTAIQVAALKNLSKGSAVYMLDSNGTVSRGGEPRMFHTNALVKQRARVIFVWFRVSRAWWGACMLERTASWPADVSLGRLLCIRLPAQPCSPLLAADADGIQACAPLQPPLSNHRSNHLAAASHRPLPLAVARELSRRGFSRVYVVTGGCQAWKAAKLRTRGYSTATALLPDKVGVM